jgi:hypothetical protein
MPKSHDRISHFESISNENLIKYMHGTPISIVSGKPIKFGSHEHQHQVRAIRKIMLKRRLEGHKQEKQVSFEDEYKSETKSDTRSEPRKSKARERIVESVSKLHDPITASAERGTVPHESRTYPPIPKESLLTDMCLKTAENSAVPQHLQNIFVPSFNNKPYY